MVIGIDGSKSGDLLWWVSICAGVKIHCDVGDAVVINLHLLLQVSEVPVRVSRLDDNFIFAGGQVEQDKFSVRVQVAMRNPLAVLPGNSLARPIW